MLRHTCRIPVLLAPLLFASLLPGAARGAEPPPPRPDAAPPPDPIANALGMALPPGWTISEPEEDLGQMQSVIEVPNSWRGNPGGIAPGLCPAPDSPIWQGMAVLRLVVRYRGQLYPGYDCRP